MIISCTPLRVSFVGGGTDLPVFYTRNEYGCVISSAINRYVYIAVNYRFDGKIRASYSKNEVVENIAEIENDRIREVLQKLDITGGIEIFYMSEIPKKLGLGGSSSFTIGLLNALYAYKKQKVFPERLARESCEIEIDTLKNPIGKQDQYATAIGGLNYFRFNQDGTVLIKPILIDEELILKILDNLVYIYLGQSHDASQILSDVNNNISENNDTLLKMRDITDQLYKELMNRNIDQFVYALNENWLLKKYTSTHISNNHIDDLYDKAIRYGALGGKVSGAGGGGFLMMYVPVEKQDYFVKKMSGMKVMKFAIDHKGSRVIKNGDPENPGYFY